MKKTLLLEIRNLYFSYSPTSKPLLENINLKIYSHEITSLVGPNGVGKTTLFKIILGFYKPLKGKIIFYTRNIGYIPQFLNLENLYPATVKEILYSVGTEEKVKKVVKELHIDNILNRKFVSLSGGQKQITLIALNLVKGVQLFLMDEPTSALDPHYQKHFIFIIENLKKQGIGIFMINHDLYLLKKVSDRVIALNRKIIYDGPPENLDKYLEKIYFYPCELRDSQIV